MIDFKPGWWLFRVKFTTKLDELEVEYFTRFAENEKEFKSHLADVNAFVFEYSNAKTLLAITYKPA